jgi:soluble lytic murein transglycosylase
LKARCCNKDPSIFHICPQCAFIPWHTGSKRGRVGIQSSNASLDRGHIALDPKKAQLARLRWRYTRVYLLASAMLVLASVAASSNPDRKPSQGYKANPSHKANAGHKEIASSRRQAAKKVAKTEHHKQKGATENKRSERAPGPRILLQTDGNGAASLPAASNLTPELAAVKQAIELVGQHKFSEATTLASSLNDPVARKLIEWMLLRDPDSPADFDRYNAFIQANSDWPSIPLLRRRAEARLWQERRGAVTVRRFVGEKPVSAIGRLALARALLSEGYLARALSDVRSVWQSAELSAELETEIGDVFPGELGAHDDVVRMDRRLGGKDFEAAMRAAERLGEPEVAIVKACDAVEEGSTKTEALLEAVPGESRSDLGYTLCRLHSLLAHDNVASAVKLLAESSSNDLQRQDLQRQDTDEWWRVCRTLARRLLDLGDAKTAYQVVREAPVPANPYYRAEFYFMPGWIALRFFSDPITALGHFAKIDEGSSDPIVLARSAYWRGRAFEAAGQINEMQAQYEVAAHYPTAYYGQLARARLGLKEIALPPPPQAKVEGAGSDLLHAADMLYAMGELDIVLTFVSDLAETSIDVDTLRALGELTAHHNDAQAMLVLGKTALARGLPMERYAFPDIGIPAYTPIAPPIDPCMVYAIVRTESAFDQRDTSPANAVGLMQVTPEAGRDTAKRFGVVYDWKRLTSDPVYNTQMGTAEISGLFKEYTGSYIMTFAGYNAGSRRVQQWVAQHGDPRDPKVDAVDWVERIPIAETRNYVQRVMENLQVYAARLGASLATREPNLHRVTNADWRTKPTFVDAIPK